MSIHHTTIKQHIQNQRLQLVSSEKRPSLQVIGPFCLRDEQGKPIPVSSKKTRILLAALAFRGEMSRRELARLLWSRHADEHALTSLRQALSKLKRCVGADVWPRLLQVSRHRIKLHDAVACELRALLNAPRLDNAKWPSLSLACKHRLFEGLDQKDSVINAWLADCRNTLATHLQSLIQQKMDESSSAEERNNLTREARMLAGLYAVAESNTPNSGQRMDSLCENYVDYLAVKVDYFWVNGVLKSLGLDQRLPKITVLEEGSKTESSVPTNIENILLAFLEAKGRVVCQGEPEYGRTALMSQLLVELLKQVKVRREAPVPVVLSVAHWSGLNLASWLKNEVSYRYDVPSEITGRFFDSKRVLLFLEGVDELPRHTLTAFVNEVNALCHDPSGLSISVFCRDGLQLQAQCVFKLNACFKLMSPFPTELLAATE